MQKFLRHPKICEGANGSLRKIFGIVRQKNVLTENREKPVFLQKVFQFRTNSKARKVSSTKCFGSVIQKLSDGESQYPLFFSSAIFFSTQ